MSNLSELLPSGGGQNQVEFVASGTLPNGKPVILNSNGTVEAITGTADNIPAGSEVIFNAGTTYHLSSSFDPNTANKLVVTYRDAGNSSYGTAVIGTLSGTSISFGSEYVFNSGATNNTTVSFDPNTAGKFVVAYKDNGNSSYGTAIVGTVSGTSISYGSETVFASASTTSTVIAFDPNTANKFVVTYSDSANSHSGTIIVGTVSGTSLSFGSEVVFNAGVSGNTNVAFDPNTANKFVLVYQDRANSEKGTGVVGTVSGTSLSFGSEYIFNTGNLDFIALSFDPSTSGKFVVAYRPQGNSYYGTACIGIISSTSIAFGSEYVFNSENSPDISVAFDPSTANKFVIAYKDQGNSSHGTTSIGTVSGTFLSFGSKAVFNSASFTNAPIAFDPNTAGKFVIAYGDNGNSAYGTVIVGVVGASNLTSTNLIGIAAEAASSGATAKINTWGGINGAQTSLTIGSDYYAQTNGTITTATGGQKLGTAISATTINMRDLP